MSKIDTTLPECERLQLSLDGPTAEDMLAASAELFPDVMRVYTMPESRSIIQRAHEIMRSRWTRH